MHADVITATQPVTTSATTSATASAAQRSTRAAAAAADSQATRLDLYAPIHKALRALMADTLLRCGRLDTGDADEFSATLGQVDFLLTICAQHLDHENTTVHPAIEAAVPGSSRRVAGEHDEHLAHIDALRVDLAQLREAAPARRPGLALRLYRHLALFIADNMQHMHHEETAHNAALWAGYSDAQLKALHDRIVAELEPEQVQLMMRWMVPALSPAERAGMLMDMRQGMPAEAFDLLLDGVRPHLDTRGWGKLAQALGVAQQPGLVHF